MTHGSRTCRATLSTGSAFWERCNITSMATYRVALRRSEEGYSVSCPGLPGCWSQGATEEEALANIKVAIREYVEAAEELSRDAETRVVEVVTA
jgi:predicted RNase H-like HicB family nuclease